MEFHRFTMEKKSRNTEQNRNVYLKVEEANFAFTFQKMTYLFETFVFCSLFFFVLKKIKEKHKQSQK